MSFIESSYIDVIIASSLQLL